METVCLFSSPQCWRAGRSAPREMNELTWPTGRKRSAESTRTLPVSDNVMADRTTALFEKWNKLAGKYPGSVLELNQPAISKTDSGDELLATYLIVRRAQNGNAKCDLVI